MTTDPGPIRIVNLAQMFASFDDAWNPRIVGELNGQHVKLARLRGDFIWHHHAEEDELFLVIEGQLTIELRDPRPDLQLGPGECVIIPRGIEHRPIAQPEALVMLFEPAGTRNTGNLHGHERTIEHPQRL